MEIKDWKIQENILGEDLFVDEDPEELEKYKAEILKKSQKAKEKDNE